MPSPYSVPLVDGVASIPGVEPTPALHEDGTIDWAYLLKVKNSRGSNSWEYLVGVPDAVEDISYTLLPRYFTVSPGNSGQATPGPRGDKGDPGERGPAGPQGDPGPAGMDGAEGIQGPAGTSGGTGAEGVQGPVGPRGEDGTSIVIDGYADSVSTLPDRTGEPAGSSFIVMDTGHIHFWNGTNWTDGGKVTGPAGADGAPGAQGPAGANGVQGIQGPRGLQGETGERGPQGLQGIPGTDASDLDENGFLRVGRTVGQIGAVVSNPSSFSINIPGTGVFVGYYRYTVENTRFGIGHNSGATPVSFIAQMVFLQGGADGLKTEYKAGTTSTSYNVFQNASFANYSNRKQAYVDVFLTSGEGSGHAYRINLFYATSRALISITRMA